MNKLILIIMMSVLFSPNVSSDQYENPMINSNTVVEVVLFEINPEHTKQQAEKAMSSLNDVLKLYYGFIERTTASNKDGKYIDIVYWTDMESAQKAAADIMKNPLAAEAFKIIKPESVQMFHFDSFNQYRE